MMPCPKGFQCPPDCQCGKHQRTDLHNLLISRGVKRAHAVKNTHTSDKDATCYT